MDLQSQTIDMIDAVTSFMQRLSQLTEWFLVVLGVILFCYTFVKTTAERRAADRSVHGN